MKRFLLALLVLLPLVAFAQAPILRNSLDTNVLNTNLAWFPYKLSIRGIVPNLEFWNSAAGADQKRFQITTASLTGQLKLLWISDDGLNSMELGYISTNSLRLGTSLYDAFPPTSVADVTGITNSTDVIGIGDFALDTAVITNALNVYAIGPNALATAVLAPFSGQIFAYGESALSGAVLTNATHIYAFGESAGVGMNGDGASRLYLIGVNAMNFGKVNNAAEEVYSIGQDSLNSANLDSTAGVYVFGRNAMNIAIVTNSDSVYAIGTSAGQTMQANSLFSTYAFGESAAESITVDTVTGIYAIGDNALSAAAVTNSDQIYGVGNAAFQGAVLNDSSDIYGFTRNALKSASITNSQGIYAFGPSAGQSTVFDGASGIYMLGDTALSSAVVTNGSFDVQALGNNALSNARLDSSSDIYAFGSSAGANIGLTNKSHIFLIGSGAQATANNQWVAGDNAYTYHFPGAYLTLNSQTNQISDSGTALTYNGVPIGGSSVSINGTNVSPANFTNTATITYAVSGSNIMASASGAAAQVFNQVTFSGTTNLNNFDCSLGSASEVHFYVSLTNNAYAGLWSNIPTGPKQVWIHLKQDGTGIRTFTITNGVAKWPSGFAFVPSTNANAVDILQGVTSPYTNSIIQFVGSQKFQ